jgi:hypothetical protein
MPNHIKNDSSILTVQQRRQEVARILAVGVLRLHARAALSADLGENSSPKNLPESDQDCLEVSEPTVLSVHRG